MSFMKPRPQPTPINPALQTRPQAKIADPAAAKPPSAPQTPSLASAFSNPFSASFNYARRNPALDRFAPKTGRPPRARPQV